MSDDPIDGREAVTHAREKYNRDEIGGYVTIYSRGEPIEILEVRENDPFAPEQSRVTYSKESK